MIKNGIPTSRTFRRDRWAWFILLVLITVLPTGVYYARHRRILGRTPLAQATADPFRLVVLEYGRIVSVPDGKHVTGPQVEAQLTMLRTRGFVPVTTVEVVNAYQEHRKLPERSVLVLFYGGYLSTYEAIHPVLTRLRWPASMFLQTDLQEKRDQLYLFWDRLQVMLDSGIWEVGVHGYQGAAHGAPAARTGEEAFRVSRSFLQANLHGATILAYARLAGVTPPLSLAPAAGIGPSLCFQTGLFGVNSPETNPLHLDTLHVDASLTPERMAAMIDSALSTPGQDSTPAQALARWTTDRTGTVQATPTGLILDGPHRAGVWLAGSRWLEDWVLEIKLKSSSGQFWFTQEDLADGHAWRLGGNAKGLHFQERTPSGSASYLAHLAPLQSGAWHTLRLTRRGPGLWAECDGAPLAGQPFHLPIRGRGDIGVLTVAEEAPGHLELLDAQIHPLPYRIQPASGNPSSQELEALTSQARETAALSPEWISKSRLEQTEKPLNLDLLRIVQNRNAWDILPAVRLLDPCDPSDSQWLLVLVDRAEKDGWNGLRLDVTALDKKDQAAWIAAADALDRELKQRHLRLLVYSAAHTEGANQ